MKPSVDSHEVLDKRLQQHLQPLLELDGSDPDALAAAVWPRLNATAQLQAEFNAFSTATRDLVRAHGECSYWSPLAASLAGTSTADGTIARWELRQKGWLDAANHFSHIARVFKRVSLPPDDHLVAQAVVSAQAVYHRSRAYDHSGQPSDLLEACAFWRTWRHDRPIVTDWMRLIGMEPFSDPDGFHPSCRVWALVGAARMTELRGHSAKAASYMQRARPLARTGSERCLLAYFDAVTATLAGRRATEAIERMEQSAELDADRLLLCFAQSSRLLHGGDGDTQWLSRGIQLAKALGNTTYEIHFRHVWAHVSYPNTTEVRRHLDAVDATRPAPAGRLLVNQLIARASLELFEGQGHEAARLIEHGLQEGRTADYHVFDGRFWALLVGARHRVHDLPGAAEALVEAERHLFGTANEAFLDWARALLSGDLDVDPRGPEFGRPATFVVDREGRYFDGPNGRVELTSSPVTSGIVSALCQQALRTEDLIQAVWPDDHSGYLNLKNRLHSAVRTLRRKGLGHRLVFEDGLYSLRGVRVVASEDRQ